VKQAELRSTLLHSMARLRPAKAFKIRYYEYRHLKERKLTCEVDSLHTPGKLWRMVEWSNWNQESTWQKMANKYPGKTVVLVQCSYRRQLPYLYLLQISVEEAVTEILEGK